MFILQCIHFRLFYTASKSVGDTNQDPYFLGSGPGGNWRGRSPVEYRGNVIGLGQLQRGFNLGRGENAYGRTDRCTDVQIPPLFYRTLSPPVPSGAAAPLIYNII